MIVSYIEIDASGYRLCDAPHASGDELNIAPHIAGDLTTPDGMRKARYLNGSWIDEEAAQLAADIAAQQISAIENAIDAHILATANAKGYNSTESCLLYVGDVNAQWNAEAVAFKAWRSQCWEYVIQEQAKIELGIRTLPTPEEAVAELPLMVWPV